MTWQILPGDCLEVLADLEDESIDAVVTDPPYGLEFMGKDWDAPWKGDVVKDPASVGGFQDGNGGNPYSRSRIRYGIGHGFQQWTEAWATELLRVLKPGGHVLAFGGTRTYHRLASGIEDAGFEIRDCLAWHYGSGFPKSLDVSKAIDKAAGAEREVVGQTSVAGMFRQEYQIEQGYRPDNGRNGYAGERDGAPITAPATDLARQWQGWGTALKPAFEPIILARKPLIGTVAENVTRFGTGALNVDGCRVGTEDQWRASGTQSPPSHSYTGGADGSLNISVSETHPDGRWPANLILDEEAGAMLDEQSGEAGAQGPASGPTYSGPSKSGSMAGAFGGMGDAPPAFYSDTGGASRFFYQAKASRAERNAGLDGSPVGCACETFTEWVNADQSQDTRAGSDTRPKRDTTGRNSADDSEWSTTGSGSRKTRDRSRTATTSTTSTETSRTTDPKTSSSSTRSRTNGPTRRTTGATSGASGSVAAESAKNGNRPTANTSTRTGTAGFSTDGADPAISNESSRTRSEGANCPDCGGVIGGGLPTRNAHPLPTVKPIDLMRWLIRLVTPPGGTVLDPFTGSGTTGIAAGLEGFEFLGIEREAEYREIAEARLRWWGDQAGETVEILRRAGLAEKVREQARESGQASLFDEEAA